MISRKSTFLLGIFTFLIPFMGLPTFWKTLFITLSGIYLVLSSLTLSIPKKPVKHRSKKEKAGEAALEVIPIYPKDNIISDVVVKDIVKEKTKRSKVIG